MRVRMRMSVLLFAAIVCASNAQNNNSSSNDSKQQQHSTWDKPIRFSTKNKESCAMVVSESGNYTRLRVSCRAPSQTTGRSYYCDFQGKPTLCRAYNLNPRHYFTQMMWELRKLKNACQGAKSYHPHMCRKFLNETQMTFLTSWPKTTAPKPSKEQRKPVVQAQPKKPVATLKPVKPNKPQTGKGSQSRKSTPKPWKTTTEQPESDVSRLATEYCWKSFHGICSYLISWFQN